MIARLRDVWDGGLAILTRDALIYRSYRWRLLTQNAGILFTLALFYYLSQLVQVSTFPDPGSYFAFVVVGLMILQVLQSSFEGPGSIRGELLTGTFERMVVSPFGPTASIVALLIFPILMSLLVGLVTLLVAAVVFGLEIEWATAPLALPIGLLGAIAFSSIALFLSAVTVRYKQAPGAAYILAAIALVSGLYFPTTLLPGWLQWTTEVQPFTPAVELLRHVLVGLPMAHSGWVQLAKLAAFALALVPVGVVAVQIAVRSSRRTGTIVEY